MRRTASRFHSRVLQNVASAVYYGPLLDQSNVPAALTAISERKLRAGYTGSCMIVQKSGTTTTGAIGFDANGFFNVASIATLCGSTPGFINTMCDQSGNGYDWVARTTSSTSGMYRIWTGTGVDLNGLAACFKAINASGAANTSCDLVSTFPSQTNTAMTMAMVGFIDSTVTSASGRMFSLYGTSNTDISDTVGMNVVRVGSSSPTAVWGLSRHNSVLSQTAGTYGDLALIDGVVNDPAEQIALEGVNGTTGSTSNGAFSYTSAALGWSGNTHASVGGYSEVILWNSALNSTQLTAVRANMAGYWATSSASSNPSGSAPTGTGSGATNLPGWNLVFDDGFTTDATEGNFLTAYGANWTAYPAADNDTYGQNPTNFGGPSSDTGKSGYGTDNISVTGSNLQLRLFVNSSGRSVGAAPVPKFPGKNGYAGYEYFRYEFRMRCPNPVQGWKTAVLVWPDSNVWTAEIDFPEGNLNGSVGGHNHWFNDTTNQDNYSSSFLLSDWHIYTCEWLSGSLKWYIDSTLVKTMTGSHISAESMHGPILQTETVLSNLNRPIPGQTCTVLYDYVRMWLPA